jgi:hypothetical protein
MLSSGIIRQLEPESQARKIPHLYYFFNFRDASTQTCENFLRSILLQLLYSLFDIHPAILELYRRCESGLRRPSVTDMTDCFITVVNTVDETWLFGDAFDECINWNDLWYFLSTVAKSQCSGLRFMFTSRPEGYIRDAVESLAIPSVDLNCDGINRDIEAYITESVARDVRFVRTPQEGKVLIRESLISRAAGMYVHLITTLLNNILTKNRFRWVALQLDAVSRCRSVNALRRVLSSLPRSLEETYRRILDSIVEEEVPHVRRILQWLCFSKRPVRIEEIAIIYQISDKIKPPFENEDELFHLEDSMDICRGLLSSSLLHTNPEEWKHLPHPTTLQIVHLAHFSVKEYLLSSCPAIWALDEELPHVAILKTVISYYLHFMTLHDIHSLPGPDLALKYSLAEYFVRHVCDHLKPVRDQSDLLPSLRLLLQPPSLPFANRVGWCLVDPLHIPGCHSSMYDRLDRLGSQDQVLNLFIAIRLRLPQICQTLLAMNIHPNLGDPILRHSPIGSPFVEAAALGDKGIMRVLLLSRAARRYHGADPLVDSSALERAVARGHTQVVRMLLEAGGDTVLRYSIRLSHVTPVPAEP